MLDCVVNWKSTTIIVYSLQDLFCIIRFDVLYFHTSHFFKLLLFSYLVKCNFI